MCKTTKIARSRRLVAQFVYCRPYSRFFIEAEYILAGDNALNLHEELHHLERLQGPLKRHHLNPLVRASVELRDRVVFLSN